MIDTATLAQLLGEQDHTVTRLARDLAAYEHVARSGRRYMLTPAQADTIRRVQEARTQNRRASRRVVLEEVLANNARRPVTVSELIRTVYQAQLTVTALLRAPDHRHASLPQVRSLAQTLAALDVTDPPADHPADHLEWIAATVQLSSDLVRLAPMLSRLADQLAIYTPCMQLDLLERAITSADSAPPASGPPVCLSSLASTRGTDVQGADPPAGDGPTGNTEPPAILAVDQVHGTTSVEADMRAEVLQGATLIDLMYHWHLLPEDVPGLPDLEDLLGTISRLCEDGAYPLTIEGFRELCREHRLEDDIAEVERTLRAAGPETPEEQLMVAHDEAPR
ncbi:MULTISPECIES: hypothetical protein [unclassified Deinococcus]|uniref:hypothetical protein n=1 Tax=unclassified Deinococcus TaxID=2623546 RepID=UPI001C2F75D5|nr:MULTISPECIES: hypothetical protein [unclassified Deinococcus]MDK2014009.1 hypothetical protein [Deinococcus sp. 43]